MRKAGLCCSLFSSIFTYTWSLKRNVPWIHWHPLWPRIKGQVLKSPRVCHVLEFVKLFKSHYNQCKFGIFSKWCISLDQECMLLNSGVFFNSAVLQVITWIRSYDMKQLYDNGSILHLSDSMYYWWINEGKFSLEKLTTKTVV